MGAGLRDWLQRPLPWLLRALVFGLHTHAIVTPKKQENDYFIIALSSSHTESVLLQLYTKQAYI